MKLTEAQKRALSMLPVTVTMWGGKPFTSLPRGIRSVSTLEALRRKGLCQSKISLNQDTWSITPSGRAALTEETGGERLGSKLYVATEVKPPRPGSEG